MSNLYLKLRSISGQETRADEYRDEPCACRETRFNREDAPMPEAGRLLELCRVSGIGAPDPCDLLFLDTETTGLSQGAGTVAFLAGAGWFEGAGFVVRQLWMRGYEEEADMLGRLAELMSGKTIVTFNGSVFDLPLLAGRFIMQRQRMPERPQIDLLKHARAIYRPRLGSVRLSRLEEELLGARRHEDLPGAMVPGIYFEYLKTRNEGPLEEVFRHNVTDVLSLTKLLCVIAGAYDSPPALKSGMDVYGMGRLYEKKGWTDDAERCYIIAGGTYKTRSFRALGSLYKRQKRMDEAVDRFCAIAGGDVFANIELAKYYEHVLKDYAKALEHTERALLLETDEREIERIAHRRARLARRINR